MLDFGFIRRATTLDLQRMIDLERSCFGENIAYSPKQIKYFVTRANSNCLVETYEDEIRGFLIVLYKRGTVVAGIETINVDNRYRGKGIAKKLLFASEEDMRLKGIRKIRLEVSRGNTAAVDLYQSSGYRIASVLKDYYHFEHFGTHDAYRMIKELTT
jgi:[ribosomal protein S18]-alanine N-acetyltransferase